MSGVIAKVSQVLDGNQWRLPYGRRCDQKVVDFYHVCRRIKPTNGLGHWNGYFDKTFSIASADSVQQVP